MKSENVEMLVGLLGILRAMKWNYWNSHWVSSGIGYYGDHLLFERLYGEEIDQQIDDLAEKITVYDARFLQSNVMRDIFNKFLDKYESIQNPFQRGLEMEKHFQKTVRSTYEELKSTGDLSLGMDDYLMATANTRETAAYLMGQRTRRGHEM
jgi:DNA-binding ferritin-like protein